MLILVIRLPSEGVREAEVLLGGNARSPTLSQKRQSGLCVHAVYACARPPAPSTVSLNAKCVGSAIQRAFRNARPLASHNRP